MELIAPPQTDHAAEPDVATCDVAIDRGHRGGAELLTYSVPAPMASGVRRGQLVWAPVRGDIVLGIVFDLGDSATDLPLKPLRAVVEPAFVLGEAQLEIARWLARQTACGLFAAAAPFLPPGVTHRTAELLRVTGVTPDGLTPSQQKLVDLLQERGEITLDSARAALGMKLTSIVPKLEAKGVVERVVKVIDATPNQRQERYVRLIGTPEGVRGARQRDVIEFLTQRGRLAGIGESPWVRGADVLARAGGDRAVLTGLIERGVLEATWRPRESGPAPLREAPAPVLSSAQAAAWMEISASLENRAAQSMLLHGVTGSGKTELYLRTVAWCLRRGLGVIVLVPEITLATQVVRRFQERFPDQVAVLHSSLSDSERYATWQSVAAGSCRVVVGPRSALFAPMDRIGAIILDEEHEAAFKQESEPRYHARTLAERIAAVAGCRLLLGSATPSVETTWRADRGEIRRLTLPDRVGVRADGRGDGETLALPEIDIIDMRLELHRGRTSIVSDPLRDVIAHTLERREQVMLLLNRRGTATVVICRSCGASVMCPNCDIPLVYHGDRGRMLCHRCNHRELPRQTCAACNGALNYFGAGTQRVEEEVHRLFPNARVARWDQDAVRRKGSHERLIRAAERGEVDIVVGTQMIAKGLDLPLVTAVGVIHADTMLHLPDFRAGERTFQLLTQVAGRAGRRTAGSHVLIQTYAPEHYAIQAASRHDYDTFYREEIEFRRRHRYPPFTRLARFLIRHAKEEVCAAEAEEQARLLARHARHLDVRADMIGPTPAFASRVRGNYQWHLILRAVPDEFERLLDGLPVRPGWTVDIDPSSVL